MRAHLVLAASAMLFSVAAYGCGSEGTGDPPTDSSGPALGDNPSDSPGGTTSSEPSYAPPSSDTGGPSGGGPASDPSSGASPGSSGGAAPGEGVPGGGASSGGSPGAGSSSGGSPGSGKGMIPKPECVADSMKESETNDTPETANELGTKTSYCGSIAASADVDYISFVLPADAKAFGWGVKWGGKAMPSSSITSEGVTRGGNEPVPVFPGKKYVIKIANAGAGPSEYVIALRIDR